MQDRIAVDQALAFRLDGHYLARRSPPGSMLRAAGACGIQNTPPGSAALSLHARVEGLTPGDVERALDIDKTLMQTFSLRGAAYVSPTADAAVFTRGVLPGDEDSMRFFIRGAGPAFDKAGMSAAEAVRLTSDAVLEVLDGRALPKSELAVELADRVAERLSPGQLEAWRSPGGYAPRQPLGEAIVRFCLYVNALEGSFCFVTRRNAAHFVRTDQWLGAPLSEADPQEARAGLARRYISCYGPSTPEHFSEWVGISLAGASNAWEPMAKELVEVDFEGRKAWIREPDLPRLMSPREPEGTRFLPPHDPYLQMRDRATLIPDKGLRRLIWRAVGNPGIVLYKGRPVAMWRPQKKGKTLGISIEQFAPLAQAERSDIEAEATTLPPFKGCTKADVGFKSL
ncbi:winged helix DNA-binding domain-containing protein [Methanocella paludicola]|uniref:winged helix DNA-binding domain-containing protein n=1 Tax=Methanocella paludicola TaxID=570267 RepID=UPI000A9B1A38|nr:winged helix DNA-binding domain-containing protein [Methanocella paludicola]